MRSAYFVRAITVAALLFSSASQAADPAIGTWYQIGQPDDETNVTITHMHPDGTFAVEFRSCRKGSLGKHVATGRWKVFGTQIEMFTDTTDGKPTAYWDRFEITINDGRITRQTWIDSNVTDLIVGYVFVATKVSADFPLPGCDPIS